MRTKDLALNPRAKKLLGRLDGRYQRFAEALPVSIADIAMSRATFMGDEFSGSFAGPSEMNPFMTCTPWLFWESFDSCGDEALLDIAEAGAYHALAMVVMDHLIDGHVERVEATTVFHQAIYERSVASFRKVFHQDSIFWTNFNVLAEKHVQGLAVEIESRHRPESIDEGTFKVIANGKVSPIAVTTTALSIASGKDKLIDPISQSLSAVAFATQMLDDVGDWQEDVETGHWTYFNSKICTTEQFRGDRKPSIDACRAMIESEWVDIRFLDKVISWLEDGLSAVEQIECTGWKAYIRYFMDFTKEKRELASSRRMFSIIDPLMGSQGSTED